MQPPIINIFEKAVRKAGKILSRDFGEIENLQIQSKSLGDFVTNADLKIEEVSYIKGFAIFFNKEKFNNIGYFDENYFLYFEEIDLCKKVIKSNNKIYLINNALIKHEGGKSHEDKYDFEMELSRNWHWMWSSFYYYKKNYNYYFALFKVLKKLVSSVVKIFFYSLNLKKDKRKIYSQRLSGLFNSIRGKKSWYRPKFDDRLMSWKFN